MSQQESKAQIYERALLDRLYPMSKATTDETLDYHRLAVFIALCTRDDLLARTFPFRGKPNPQVLLDAPIGIDTSRISAAEVERMAPYREAFAAVQRAWLDLSEYQDPPCPTNARLKKVVDVTKDLQDVPD